MKNTYLLLAFYCFIFSSISNAQNTEKKSKASKQEKKQIKEEIICEDPNDPLCWDLHACDSIMKIGKLDFKKILQKEFTKALDGSADFNVGSFASLDVSKATGVLKYTSADSKGDLFTIGANGGIDEGVLNLFSNKKPNSNVGMDLTTHILIRGKKFSLSGKDCNEKLEQIKEERRKFEIFYQEQIKKVKLDSARRQIEVDCRNDPCPTIPFNIDNPQKCHEAINYIKKILSDYKLSDSIKTILKLDSILSYLKKDCNGKPCSIITGSETPFCYTTARYLKTLLHSTLKDSTKQRFKIDSLLNSISINCNSNCLPCGKNACVSRADSLIYEYNISRNKLEKLLLRSRLDSLKKIRDARIAELAKVEVSRFRISWISVGASFKNNSFKLLNQEDTIIKTQLSTKSSNNTRGNITFNHYRWIKHGISYYFNIGLSSSTEDNFDDLSKKDVTDTYKLTNGNVNREYTGKVTAYTGNYKELRTVYGGFCNAYIFLFDNKAAIHLQGDVNLEAKSRYSFDLERPIYDASLGLLLCPIDAKDKSNRSVQNLELFIKIKDLFDGLKYENEAKDKTVIGLRFTTPIKFKT